MKFYSVGLLRNLRLCWSRCWSRCWNLGWSVCLLTGCMQMNIYAPAMQATQHPIDSEALYNSMATGEWLQAHSEVSRQLATSAGYALGYINLGIISEQLNRPTEALDAYLAAVSLAPENIAALNRLALLYRRQGNFSSAEQHYRRALGVNPEHAGTHRNLGILYDLYLGNFASAIEHYEAYQRFSQQDDPHMIFWLQDLRRRRGEQITQPSVAGVPK